MIHHDWGTGGQRHGLLLTLSTDDLSRVGNCWMKGRLRDGDLVMAIAHSGDCFWTYCIIDHGFKMVVPMTQIRRHGYKAIMDSKFGAYVLGTPYEFQPTEREVHRLMAGDICFLGDEIANALSHHVVP